MNEILEQGIQDRQGALEALERAEQGKHQPTPAESSEMHLASPNVDSAQRRVDRIQTEIDSIQDTETIVGQRIAAVLRLHFSDHAPYLGGILLWKVDLSGINLGGAQFTHTDIQNCDVSGANFGNVQNTEASNWSYT